MNSIWLLIITGIVLGIPLYIIVRSSRTARGADGRPEGIGGWLMLLAMGQTLAPLRSLGELADDWNSYNELLTLPNGRDLPLILSSTWS